MNIKQKVSRIASIKNSIDECQWFKIALERSSTISLQDTRTGSYTNLPINISKESTDKIKSILLDEIIRKEKSWNDEIVKYFRVD